MTPAHPSSRGFSLIELLVVLIIAGILAMVGITSLGSRRKAAVRDLTLQMYSVLVDAQQLARSTGQMVTLHVKGTTSDTLSIDFEYTAPPNGTLTRGGGFSVATQGVNAMYGVPGIRKAQVTATNVDCSSFSGLGLVSNWNAFFVDANALFQGSDSTAMTFSNQGQISQDCFVTVCSPTPRVADPIGLVVATRRNGIHAYIFTGEQGATWRSL